MGRSGFHGLVRSVLAGALVDKIRETVKGGIKGVGFLAGGYIEKMKNVGNYKNLIHIRNRDLRTARSELAPAGAGRTGCVRGTLISDWFPTILDATGCSIDESLDGYSHWKTLFNENNDIYHPRQEILHNIDPMSDTDGTESRKFKSG